MRTGLPRYSCGRADGRNDLRFSGKERRCDGFAVWLHTILSPNLYLVEADELPG